MCHEIFSTVILCLQLIQERQLSVSGVIMCTVHVKRFCISLPRKCCQVHWPARYDQNSVERVVKLQNKQTNWGWLGVAKMSCILRRWGVQLVLAYSWARPAILGREECFYFFRFFTFIPFPFRFLLFSHFLWEMTRNDPQGLTRR